MGGGVISVFVDQLAGRILFLGSIYEFRGGY